MVFPTYKLKVVEVQSNLRVVYVLRAYVYLVVYDLTRLDYAFSPTDFTQPTDFPLVRFSGLLPCFRTV